MKAKNVLKKTGGFLKKHKNFGMYIGGLSLMVIGLLNEGEKVGYEAGKRDAFHATCDIFEKAHPGIVHETAEYFENED